MEYVSQNHSKHLLIVHLIFSCKYRKKLLIKYGYEIKKIMYNIAQENDLNIIEMETDKDHIHILVQYQPIRSVLEIVRLFKQISTYRIWRQNNNANYLKRDFWKENTFWGDGYFACSIGQVSKETIEKYIQNQG
jgi:putative transposase